MKVTAEESLRIKKTREKLRKKLEEMEEGVTPQALKRKSHEIQRWIARHASERTPLKKSFSLFDGNKNPATLSQRVHTVIKKLKGLN